METVKYDPGEVGRNPNKTVKLNSAPEGPFSHLMGEYPTEVMKGDETASGRNGETFHFK